MAALLSARSSCEHACEGSPCKSPHLSSHLNQRIHSCERLVPRSTRCLEGRCQTVPSWTCRCACIRIHCGIRIRGYNRRRGACIRRRIRKDGYQQFKVSVSAYKTSLSIRIRRQILQWYPKSIRVSMRPPSRQARHAHNSCAFG